MALYLGLLVDKSWLTPPATWASCRNSSTESGSWIRSRSEKAIPFCPSHARAFCEVVQRRYPYSVSMSPSPLLKAIVASVRDRPAIPPFPSLAVEIRVGLSPGKRRTEEPALGGITAPGLQRLSLPGLLDALRHHLHP